MDERSRVHKRHVLTAWLGPAGLTKYAKLMLTSFSVRWRSFDGNTGIGKFEIARLRRWRSFVFQTF
jgi:hypothetical protein